MAVCKRIEKSIEAHQYVYDSIAYILSPKNRNGDEKCFQATCLNCVNDGTDGLAKQFYETRRAYNKDNKILAHQYVQSFSPNENITPELAHKIGVELAKKIASSFQVIVSTHIDKDHIHNHFIINAVNPETGMKWTGDKSTLNNMRKESDRICKYYGLSTIKNKSGLRGVDQATQKLAEKGKSWKVELCKALDEATQICNNKKDFVDFMKRKNFDITRYGELDITFQKICETKKIRASTLAKQFGDYYKKENFEKLMGFYRLPKIKEQQIKSKPKQSNKPFISEFEKYEKNYFSKKPPPAKVSETRSFQKLIKNSLNPFLLLLIIIMKLLIRQKRKSKLDKKYLMFHQHLNPQAKYKIHTLSDTEKLAKIEKLQTTVGNIPYKKLIESQGENYRIRLSLSAVPKLYAYPFFFSAKLYKDYALVTVKEKDKQLLQKALEVEDIQILEKHNKYYTPLSDYNTLKKRAAELGVKVEFLMIQKEQLSLLDEESDRFVAIETDGKIRLAFLPQNKDYILCTLYPNKYNDKNYLFSVGRNSKVNTRLRSEALLDGQKMSYRTLTKEQVEKLYSATNSEELFAVFNKNVKGENLGNKYNIAFKEGDEEKINMALENQNTNKHKI